MDTAIVIGAFGEEAAAKLSGLSIGQLKMWDRTGFLRPSYAAVDRHLPHNRIYSFRDIVSLRVLGQLRNKLRVPMQELRRVSHALSDLGEAKWTVTTLYVLGRRVVFDDPRTSERREVVSGQRVFDIPLLVAISDTKDAISKLNNRHGDQLGHIVREKFVLQNEPVFEGSRISVAAIERYCNAGYSNAEILSEYPSLAVEDVNMVRRLLSERSAA